MNLIPKIITVKGKAEFSDVDFGRKDPSVWWEHDLYSKVPRYKCLNWLGVNWFKMPYLQSIKGTYFIPAKDTVKVISEMIDKKVILPLNQESKILEPGCNVGRNLFYLQDAFGSSVHGIDISQKALDTAKNDIWKERKNFLFEKKDVLDVSCFSDIADNHYDLVITRWHLIHVKRCEAKEHYIKELKRIGKTVVLIEPTREGRKENELYHEGLYCLSWDDWSKDYGFTLFESSTTEKMAKHDASKVYYFKKS